MFIKTVVWLAASASQDAASIEIVTPPPPAPPVVSIARPAPKAEPLTVVISPPEGPSEVVTRFETFRIEVKMGSERLWSGELATSDQSSGSFNQSLREPVSQCLKDGAWRPANFAKSEDLRVTISMPRYPRSATPDPDAFSIDVRRQRALPDCDGGGEATVSFQRPLTIKRGETRDIAGDAGLAVRVTRLAVAK